MMRPLLSACLIALPLAAAVAAAPNQFRPVPLQSRVVNVQPMTGLVMWEQGKNNATDSIALEYSYMRYGDVVRNKGEYDWTVVESKLNSAASRKHQAILRFWDCYPGRPSPAPEYFKTIPDYKETVAQSENRDTGFPDWSHPEYQRFILEFYDKFAEKYDNDPRLAFLQVGFGLWSEYHIYSGPEILGKTLPSIEFQGKFLRHIARVFKQTPWGISQDSHQEKRTPFLADRELLKLDFGVFDDSFHLAWKPSYNRQGWEFFGMDRYRRAPAGGEILFRTKEFAEMVAANWAAETRNFGITYHVMEQWPRWATMEKLKEHSMACGYRFRVTAFEASPKESRVAVTNTGVAPIYYDAYVAVNGVRSKQSLKFLQPGESRQFTVASGGAKPELTIECDRLVPGQRIEFDADLK